MGRFLVIGLDGAEPSLVERWMAAGRLPNLAGLRDRGAYLHLESTAPCATFPAWTTCVTGVNPGRHGLFDFTEMTPGAYAIRFTNSTFRKAPALWDVLSAAGKRVCVLGVPATYPPDKVNGVMVAGFDSPVATTIDRSFVHPPEIFGDVQGWRFADFQESNIGTGWHETALEKMLAKIADKTRIATNLLAREPWDFSMVVFSESDTVAHHFWLFHDENSPRHRTGPSHAIRTVYEALDTAVGKLVDAASSDVTVAVVSDHGFGGAGTGVVHLNNFLAEHGYLQFSGDGDSLMKRVALAATPERWRGTLFRRFRGLATRAESQSRFAGIDWTRTTAWSEELNYFPSVRVNLEGREPQGRVAPSDYDRFCDELCERLEAWEPIRKASRRNELYHGGYVDRSPDIVVELALEDGYSYSCLRSRGGPALRRIGPDECFGGKERGMTGNHRPTGVLFLSKSPQAGSASIEDVAPTVLAEIGVPGPDMDGTSLLDAYTETGSPGQPPDKRTRAYSPEQEEEIESRLRDLGYLE